MTNYLDKGRLLLQQKEYTKALEFFQAAIESEESPKDAYLGLAEVYFSLQKDKQGREALFKALSLDPYNEQGLMMAQQHCFAKETFIESKGVPSLDQIAKPPVGVSSNTKYTLIPPSVNHTPYYAIEYTDGNLIYIEITKNGCTIVAPNREVVGYGQYINNWQGYKKPNGILNIPDSVCVDGEKKPIIEIGESAFWGCELSSVIIPDSIVSIGSEAFFDNRILKDVYIPNHVRSIHREAFKGCLTLEKIHLPERIVVLEERVFDGTHISSIDIPASVKKIFSNSFGHRDLFNPLKLIMHGAPPFIEKGNWSFDIYFKQHIEAYIPTAYLNEYKFAQYWQEMKLIPY